MAHHKRGINSEQISFEPLSFDEGLSTKHKSYDGNFKIYAVEYMHEKGL